MQIGSPCGTKPITFIPLKKSLDIQGFSAPDLADASIGKRIRYLRRKLRLAPAALAAAAGIGPNALLNLEREDAAPKEWVVGRILKAFGEKVREAFPGAKDVYDYLVPPKDFASWLRNFRLRRGLQQAELAKVLGVSKVSICHYEGNLCKPRPVILERFRRAFKLNGELDRFL